MEKLSNYLKQYDKLAVALSGGVDSACLLREAVSAIGPSNVLAITAETDFTPRRELALAKRIAELADTEHRIIPVDVLAVPQVAENGPERCYYCKRAIFSAIQQEAWLNGCAAVADGSNADDLGDYRPGMRALEELGIVSPFLACGMGKKEIYELSGGLPTEKLPAYACLATRIPTDTPITLTALGQIEDAEDALHAMGMIDIRVRHHGDVARIEVPKEKMEAYLKRAEEIESAVKGVGFRYVSLDLGGYKKGNMNAEER